MKRSRFSETQIVSILKEAEAGAKVKDRCRRYGIRNATYYNWKSKYGGMSASELKRLKETEADVCRAGTRELRAEGSDREEALGPLEKREAARYLVAEHDLSRTRACAAVRLSRSSWYRSAPAWEQRDRDVIDAINAVLARRPRWGFWKCYDRLRLDGHSWNHKRVRVHRVYKAMKLNLPRRTKRRLPQRVRQPMVVDAVPNAEWSMDFMSDVLYGGRRFRTLNILDEGVREVLDIVIDTSIPGGRVVRTLDRLVEWRGKPTAIRVDNGPEYLSAIFAD